MRIATAALMLASGTAGFLVTFANRWGADTSGGCRDTFSNVLAACIAPGSPAWALAIGTAAPMAVALGLMAVLRRARR